MCVLLSFVAILFQFLDRFSKLTENLEKFENHKAPSYLRICRLEFEYSCFGKCCR